MSDSFLILPELEGGEALLAVRSGASVEVTRGDVDTLSAGLSRDSTIILPGQRVRAFLTDVPAKIKGVERLNVASFAHEDRLASAPSDLHIVVASGDPAATLIVGRDVMDAVVARFDAPTVVADFDALADLAGEAVALLDRVVTPGQQGLAVDAEWADGPLLRPDDETLAQAIFARLDRGEALNLRAGAYRRRLKIQAGPWGRVAAVALLCAVLGLGGVFTDARAKSAQAEALRADAKALYTQATGQAAPDNLSRLARTATVSDADPGAFLALSDVLFRALANHPDVEVERLSFETRENTLRLRLIYPDFDAASALEVTVSEMGATFVPGGVREQSGQFIGDAALILEGAS